MNADRAMVDFNDAILFRTVRSGASEDVLRLFQMSNYDLTFFSNHALNWSVIKACYLGHESLIQFLLQDGARLEVQDDEGNTPLMISSEKGNSSIVNFLLMKGAYINAANRNGDTALILASSDDVIQQLLGNAFLDVDQQNVWGNTALMCAIESSQFAKIRLLVNAGACVNGEKYLCQGRRESCIYRINNAGESALGVAERIGVRKLIEIFNQARILMCSPLVCAAINVDSQSFDFLLQNDICHAREILSEPNILYRILQFIYRKSTVSDNDKDMIKKICHIGIDVNSYAKLDQRPISLALEIGNYDIVETLCLQGAVIGHENLIRAVQMGYKNLIPLLAVNGANMNLTDEQGNFQYRGSALDDALTRSDIGSAKLLLYHGSELDVKFALNKAVENSTWKSLIFLLEQCPEESKSILETHHEIFHESVAVGDISIMEALLASGANIHGVFDNKTPLMNAVDIDVIKYLLNNEADVNFKTETTTLINTLTPSYQRNLEDHLKLADSIFSLTEQHLNIVNLLFEKEALINDSNERGQTALIYSVSRGCSIKLIELLLEKSCRVNQVDSSGNSALHEAVSLRNKDIMMILLRNRANVNLRNNNGCTPLHGCIMFESFRSSELVQSLLENHADVHIQDNVGNTPLLLASQSFADNSATVELLVAAGSDVNHTNQDGMSALMLAADHLNDDIVSLLLKSNADVNIVSTKLQQPKTALSILLNKWYPNRQSQHLALELLKHGANVKYVLPEVIHRIIAMGNVQLAQQLLISGLGPKDIVLCKNLMGWPLKTISPLSICLMEDQIQLAKYFIDNWYLTQSDIKLFSRHASIVDFLDFRNKEFLKEVSKEPPRLELLSFICVSTAVGLDIGREDRVHKLALPHILQEYLLFKKVKEEKINDDNIEDENLYFCHEITQLDKTKYHSEFYEKDEECIEYGNYLEDDSSVEDAEDSSSSHIEDSSPSHAEEDSSPSHVTEEDSRQGHVIEDHSQLGLVVEEDSRPGHIIEVYSRLGHALEENS